jgi:hypothetical protein
MTRDELKDCAERVIDSARRIDPRHPTASALQDGAGDARENPR